MCPPLIPLIPFINECCHRDTVSDRKESPWTARDCSGINDRSGAKPYRHRLLLLLLVALSTWRRRDRFPNLVQRMRDNATSLWQNTPQWAPNRSSGTHAYRLLSSLRDDSDRQIRSL